MLSGSCNVVTPSLASWSGPTSSTAITLPTSAAVKEPLGQVSVWLAALMLQAAVFPSPFAPKSFGLIASGGTHCAP